MFSRWYFYNLFKTCYENSETSCVETQRTMPCVSIMWATGHWQASWLNFALNLFLLLFCFVLFCFISQRCNVRSDVLGSEISNPLQAPSFRWGDSLHREQQATAAMHLTPTLSGDIQTVWQVWLDEWMTCAGKYGCGWLLRKCLLLTRRRRTFSPGETD